MKYVILEKAKPYTRVRRGKFEHVKGYAGRSIRAYHGSSVSGLKEIGLVEGVRSRPFMGTTFKVKSGAVFFTPDKKVAEFFARNRTEFMEDSGVKGIPTVYERYLNIKNPLDLSGKNVKKASKILDKLGIDLEGEILGIEGFGRDLDTLLYDKEIELSDLWKLADKPEIVEKLKSAGYDGVIFKETGDRGISYAIFDPKQAKR
jgi:hypothetical protein